MWLVPSLRRVSRYFSRVGYDRELNFVMTVPLLPIQAGHYELFLYSGQVRSLTYDVIIKPPRGHKMPQLRNAANGRQSFSRR